MSNILATVGRNVQYIDKNGTTLAAIVTEIQGSSVQLNVFLLDGSAQQRINGVFEYNPNGRSTQTNVYKNTWQGR